MTPSHLQDWVHPKLQIKFLENYRLLLRSILYTTAYFKSLLLYPTSPYIIKYHHQLYPTYHIIGIAHRSHSCPFKCHTNRYSFLSSFFVPNTDYNQNTHKQPKYLTTYTIIHFYIFYLLQHRWELPVGNYQGIRGNYYYPFCWVIILVILHDFIWRNYHRNQSDWYPFFLLLKTILKFRNIRFYKKFYSKNCRILNFLDTVFEYFGKKNKNW